VARVAMLAQASVPVMGGVESHNVQFEYGRVNIVARRLLADFAELFESHDYDLFRVRRRALEQVSYSFDLENFFVANFLAVHRDRKDLRSCAT